MVGDWTLGTNLWAGVARKVAREYGFPETELEARDSVGVVLEASYRRWLHLRADYFPATVSVRNAELTRLFEALRASGESDVARELEFEEEQAAHIGFGIELEMAGWTVGSEYSKFRLDNTFTGPQTGYSLMIAYRWRDWTPVVVVGRQYAGPGPDALNAMDPTHPLAPAVEALTTASEVDDRYLSIGARYDITEALALKVDYTHREARAGDRGSSAVLASGLVFTF